MMVIVMRKKRGRGGRRRGTVVVVVISIFAMKNYSPSLGPEICLLHCRPSINSS
jgi:hypothetical protein